MTKDEALKMAIDYLNGSYEAHKVRKACQEALEQPVVKDCLTVQKPLTISQIKNLFDDRPLEITGLIYAMVREVEKAHGIHQ